MSVVLMEMRALMLRKMKKSWSKWRKSRSRR